MPRPRETLHHRKPARFAACPAGRKRVRQLPHLQFNSAALDTTRLLSEALARNVAFMPGEAFFASPAEAYPSMRLNFSHAEPGCAAPGLAILAGLTKAQLDATPPARAPASPGARVR